MELRPFSAQSAPGNLKISVSALWTGSVLELVFELSGTSVSSIKNLDKNLKSSSFAKASPERRDELWQTTCFEAFIMPEWHPSYWEINFSADRAWNLYRFTSYREGQTRPTNVPVPSIEVSVSGKKATISAKVNFGEELELIDRTLRFTPAVVIETLAGEKSYWSLEHRQQKPDFHHSDHFVVTLDPRSTL
jgi:hypothetical protein